ncbi:DUF4199 domain-containing protein [Marinilabilia rubra]|uniref:DUF4199 domain-containing protein n=1 Tax=Marinilabilia rubra TaxID=2162893 RepID=A0A2U2B440_9BACT|nr:DUF4199 domain-containing protein [Marinilabilia rubra]PWD97830.1 DUF4199 domain-containing protein [Marinilabilia rubra]
MKGIKIELKWAVIFVIANLLWMYLERLVGLHDELIDKHAILTNLYAIPAVAIYVLALLDKRKNYYNGIMSYKEGVISGLIITLIVTLLNPVSQYLTSEVIAPDYFPNVIDYVSRTGEMTRAEAEAYFNLPSYISMGLIYAPIMGIITTLIVAFFARKKG